MTEGTTAPVSSVQNVASSSPKKQKKSTKGKTHSASHPKYSDMIKSALKSLNERSGSSRAAILKYVLAHYTLDPVQANQHLKLALKNGVKNKHFKQTKGNGASGSFKLAEGAKVAKKKKATKTKKASTKSSKGTSGTKKRPRSKSAGTKSAKKVATPANTNASASTPAAGTTPAATTSSTTAAKPKKVKIAKGTKTAKPKKPTQGKKKIYLKFFFIYFLFVF